MEKPKEIIFKGILNKTPSQIDQAPRIVLYIQHYLSPSMTFIYRQLIGVADVFEVAVICSQNKENLEIFPFNNLNFYPASRKNIFVKKLLSKVEFKSYEHLQNVNPFLFGHQKNIIKKYLYERDISLIHAHFGPSAIEILPIAKLLNINLVVSFHGYDASNLLRYDDYKKNIKNIFGNAYIIVPSQFMLDTFHSNGFLSKNETVIHYGIPNDVFIYRKRVPIHNKVINNEELVFLQISNFVEKKGHIYTVQAFNNFIRSYPNSKLILAGQGPLKEKIELMVHHMEIKDKVIFPGLIHHEKVRELLNSADVFLHHSITSETGDMEGIPNVIMEAMACGLPTISTYHAGIPELIENDINGYLVNERNVDEYTQKLINILNDNGIIGLKARQKIEKEFDLSLQNRKLIDLYNRILN